MPPFSHALLYPEDQDYWFPKVFFSKCVLKLLPFSKHKEILAKQSYTGPLLQDFLWSIPVLGVITQSSVIDTVTQSWIKQTSFGFTWESSIGWCGYVRKYILSFKQQIYSEHLDGNPFIIWGISKLTCCHKSQLWLPWELFSMLSHSDLWLYPTACLLTI